MISTVCFGPLCVINLETSLIISCCILNEQVKSTIVLGMLRGLIVLLMVMAMHASVSLPIKHAVPVEEG